MAITPGEIVPGTLMRPTVPAVQNDPADARGPKARAGTRAMGDANGFPETSKQAPDRVAVL